MSKKFIGQRDQKGQEGAELKEERGRVLCWKVGPCLTDHAPRMEVGTVAPATIPTNEGKDTEMPCHCLYLFGR